jgi:hypothetical protein
LNMQAKNGQSERGRKPLFRGQCTGAQRKGGAQVRERTKARARIAEDVQTVHEAV